MRPKAKGIGLAIIGAGRVGLFRGGVANLHPCVEWIGLAEIKPERGEEVGRKIGADFVTTDYRELLARPEVNAVIVATDEHLHVGPVLDAAARRLPMLIEKPLATKLDDSARVLDELDRAGIDAVVGYTQRFRRRWLAAKEKVATGALGDVTLVTSRAFMNRLVAIDNYRRSDAPETISPMVISGTHALDIVMWYLEKKTPVEVYARSVDKVLGPDWKGIDATAGMISMSDGTLYHLNISWALPITWPGAVYSLDVGIVGTHGVLTIDGLPARQEPAGRLHGQLSARRHGARPVARPDARRDRGLAESRRGRRAEPALHRARGASAADADQGDGRLGQAEAADPAAARNRRDQGTRPRGGTGLNPT
ncbi:Gfo/Idh/MocA family protein [Bosea sp. (in: a-proteobacteria)]|uniref:Gfo/Idh/MocA family protein n=1 Tax=Bosea sp. (in: a-proteobacteria) TaxID=1871050 RepID=UPI003F71004F